jgi:membrane associated rhomboid family serine protease
MVFRDIVTAFLFLTLKSFFHMENSSVVGLLIIIVTFLISYKGFKDPRFFQQHLFEVDKILINKEYSRMLSSGFLHANWLHLGFNMMALYAFSASLEDDLGILNYTIIYFASLMGGSLLSLFIHKNHGNYSAIGASGAVCGVIFASIALYPDVKIGTFGLFMPSWVYAVLFMSISIFGIKSQASNIGHDAHLGGALIGMLTAVALRPESIKDNYWILLLVAVPTIAFIIFFIRKPELMLVENMSLKKKGFETMEDKFNAQKLSKAEEIDRILEKISKRGVDSLSQKEKDILDKFSEK